MVQIDNFHIGKAETALKPEIGILEAGLLWDFLAARYLCIEETQFYHSLAHDTEFKKIISYGIKNVLEDQVNKLEEQMDKYKVALPERPPKSMNMDNSQVPFNDRFIFQRIFIGCSNFIDYSARVGRSMVTTDSLRSMVFGFLKNELSLYDKLCKYGKLKGWTSIEPIYRPY